MIKTFVPFGYDGAICDVNVDLSRGIPAFDVVGVVDGSCQSLRLTVRIAVNNSGLQFPPERVLVSLYPVGLKKSEASLHLPVALAVLEAQYKLDDSEKILVLGELELSGEIRSVRACYAALLKAKDEGIKYAILPEKNKMEPVPEGMRVCYASHLSDAFKALRDKSLFYAPSEKETGPSEIAFDEMSRDDEGMSFDDIKNHNGLKFAMAVAAAGHHSLLVAGGPGSGKTTCLQHFPELLPLLSAEEKADVDKISSLAGLSYRYNSDKAWVRPFRMPHQTASIEGICGGGPDCRPGEITLAHNGVLFLDEAAEFRTSVLQMLRVPMEKHSITLSRAGRSTTYPAHFQLLMAVNPCPCGNYGSTSKVCLCSAKSIDLYWKKFSAPLLDRVAIRFYDDKEHNDEWMSDSLEEYHVMIRRAWERRKERGNEGLKIEPDADKLYESEAVKYNWSSRAKELILSVAVTISDMLDYSEVSVQAMKLAIKLHEIGPDFDCASTL